MEREIDRTDVAYSGFNDAVNVEIVKGDDGNSYIRSYYFQKVGMGHPVDDEGNIATTTDDIAAYRATTDTFYESYYQMKNNRFLIVDAVSYTHQTTTYMDERPEKKEIVQIEINGDTADAASLNDIFTRYNTSHKSNG